MKETQPMQKDNIAVVKQVQQKKNNFLGSTTLHDGHSIWEFNKLNFELRKAEYEHGSVFITGSKSIISSTKQNKRVRVKENCFYISSLNEKNAVKKIKKLFKHIPYVIAIND